MMDEKKRPEKKPYYEESPRMSESENHGLRMWDNGYNQACSDWEPYHKQELKRVLEGLKDKINSYAHDEEAHLKGKCSYSLLALCSAEEQKIQLKLHNIIDQAISKECSNKIICPKECMKENGK